MKLTNSLKDIGVVPLQVSGHLMRISIASQLQQRPRLDEFYFVLTWIEKNCPTSSVINDSIAWNPIAGKNVLLVEFCNKDLEVFCAHWSLADGTKFEPIVEWSLLRYSDYLEYIRCEVRERWNHQVPLAIGFNSAMLWDYDLSDEDNRQRWQDLYRLRHVNGQVTQWEMLDDEAQLRLIHLNNQLREVERWSFTETMAIRGSLLRANQHKATNSN